MTLPTTAHTSQPWEIHTLRPDLDVLDVWRLPTPGGPDDFPRLVALATSFDLEHSSSSLVRLLMVVRWKLGALLRWDPPRTSRSPFTPILETDREWAGEVVNRTVDGVLHLGWVRDEIGHGYHGRLAVLVKPNGWLGRAYLAGISPFRHLIVYPALLRDLEREWLRRTT